MNEEKFKQQIEERWGRNGRHREKGRIWAGLFLLIIGGLLLARASGVLFPSWFFTWPMILIAVGLFSGFRHRFRNAGWLIPTSIGAIFLYDKMSPDVNMRPYLWPVILMIVGLFILFRPRGPRHHFKWDGTGSMPEHADDENRQQWRGAMKDSNDAVDVTAIFGGVKKNVLSKTFKGGDIVAFMGGAEIDLRQADFSGKVVLDSFNMFGGTKLIVPADWDVQSQIVAIFGGVDDKRPPATNVDRNKVLFLDGTCLFGGVEIKSF